jgi:hypothetical protein
MKTWITVLTCAVLLALGGSFTILSVAQAQGAATVDAGVAPDPDGYAGSPALVAAPTAPDPVDDPAGFWAAMKTAKSQGWPVAIMLGVAVLAGVLRKRITWLAVEGTRRAAAVTGVAAVAAAAYDGLTGGGWGPLILAVAAAAALIYDPKSKPVSSLSLGGGKAPGPVADDNVKFPK